MLKYFPSLGYDRVWLRFPMARGYALIGAARTHDAWLQFSGIGLADGGFVKQELLKLQKTKKN